MIVVKAKLVQLVEQDISKTSIIISVAARQTSVMSGLVLSKCLCILMLQVTVSSWNIVDFRILYILLANKMWPDGKRYANGYLLKRQKALHIQLLSVKMLYQTVDPLDKMFSF